MGDREDEGLVGAWMDAQPAIGLTGVEGRARVDDNELRAALQCLLDLDGTREPGRGRVVAPQNDQVGPGEVRHADVPAEGETRGEVLVPVTDLGAVDRVGGAVAADQPFDPGDAVGDVGAAPGRDRKGHLFGRMPRLYVRHPGTDLVKRLIPRKRFPGCRRNALRRRPAQRRGETIRMVDEFRRREPFRTELLARRVAGQRLDPVDPPVLEDRGAAAA